VIVALLVTHNSERWIESTLRSVTMQTRPLDRIIIVDDRSTDGTRRMAETILGSALDWVKARPQARDLNTRIAENFAQGLQMCAPDDIVVLGDHDDVWAPTRVEHQVQLMERHPNCVLLASDGNLVDVEGVRIGQTLRDVFPVALGFNELSPRDQLKYLLHSSVATGGACAVRPGTLHGGLMPPPGWLHDRWWSIVGVVQSGLRIDEEAVINYRVQPEQVLGLNRGSQGLSHLHRIRTKVRDSAVSLRKTWDIAKLRELSADPHMRETLSFPKLILFGLRSGPSSE